MFQLQKFYELMKKEFSDFRLKTCKEIYENSKYRPDISKHLKELGFKCSRGMESTLFFALVDIVVVVDSSNNFYYATFSESKLLELKKIGRLLPKKGETDYSKESSLVSSNTFQKINEYLANNKFHFIKLTNLDEDSFYCTISGMKPYPTLTNERVYSLDFIAIYYWEMSKLLVRGMFKVNDIVCSASPVITQGKQLNNCASTCKINVKTLDGLLEEFYVWDIKSIEQYASSALVENLFKGVCKVGKTYLTLNREILEVFYGSNYLEFESKGVRIRYCLEELFGITGKEDLRYYISKYKFYDDKEICACKSVYELKTLLRSRVRQVKYTSKTVNARVLASPNAILSKHISYYKKIPINADFEVVKDIESIFPQVYRVSGVCSLGYCIVEVLATSPKVAETTGKKEFIRQFGNLYNDKILGIQKGSEICRGKHPVFNINIDTQRKLCEVMRWGYRDNYVDYSRYIKGIISTLNLDLDVLDDYIKLFFVNNIAREAGNSKNITLEVIGSNLDTFLTKLVKSTQKDITKALDDERKRLRK